MRLCWWRGTHQLMHRCRGPRRSMPGGRSQPAWPALAYLGPLSLGPSVSHHRHYRPGSSPPITGQSRGSRTRSAPVRGKASRCSSRRPLRLSTSWSIGWAGTTTEPGQPSLSIRSEASPASSSRHPSWIRQLVWSPRPTGRPTEQSRSLAGGRVCTYSSWSRPTGIRITSLW